MVFLWCCGGVFVVVFVWWCFGGVVFLWWCGGVIKDCHQTSPKVLLKLWLCLKIVSKDCPKFC